MRIKALLILIVLLRGNERLAQAMEPDSLVNIIREIASNNTYEASYAVGYGAIESTQYRQYKILLSGASTDQLTDLASHHQNGVVRLYSLRAIIERKLPIPKPLQEKFSHDLTKVIMLDGCLGRETTIKAIASIILKEKQHTGY